MIIDLPPSASLAPFVKGVRLVTGPASLATYRRFPDGETELLVRLGHGSTTASVIGTRSHALRKHSSGQASTLLVRFRIGGAHLFFGRPLSELTDSVVPLPELWPRDRWSPLEATSESALLAHAALRSLEDVLTSGDAFEPWGARRVRRAVRSVLAAPRLPSASQLARDLGASERNLRRVFKEIVGLSPKRFIRIVRFRRALGWARQSKGPDWSAIAQRAGYFDQAHLIADFRELTGATPAALLREAGARTS